jgi:hypothetical protein
MGPTAEIQTENRRHRPMLESPNFAVDARGSAFVTRVTKKRACCALALLIAAAPGGALKTTARV